MTLTLLLIRHGETSLNLQGRYQGHTDAPLSPRGEAQASQLAAAFRHHPLTAVVSSDLRRAVDTAAPLGAVHGLTVQQEPRLRELHFGDWEGLHWEAIPDPQAQEAWWADPWGVAPPGGETTAALWLRVRSALTDLGQRHTGTVAVVTHGGPLRLIHGFLQNGRPSLSPTPPKNGGWLLLPPQNLADLMK